MRGCGLVCFFLAGLLAAMKVDSWVFASPERILYYIEEYRSGRKEIADCFERFGRQDVLPFSEFMQKCVKYDWQREEYRRLKSDSGFLGNGKELNNE